MKPQLTISPVDGSVWGSVGVFAGTAAVVAGIVYAFVVLVDPYDTLPLSPPADRPLVAGNQRFSYPSLARSNRFDSAIVGTSSSRLLRPEVLNPLFDGIAPAA